MRRYQRIQFSLKMTLLNPSLTMNGDMSDHDGFTVQEWLEEIEKTKHLFISVACFNDWYLSYFVVMDVVCLGG
jgi:hypothetical protein